jgi:uncharacterized membrane protein YphA (DoxX/SURF4 family)
MNMKAMSTKEKIEKLLTSLPIQTLSGLILGGVFIYASIDKIMHPHQFAYIIYNFQLLPLSLVYFSAITMPWIEMLAGLCVVSGMFRRAGAAILGGLLLVFSIAISINLARGLKFDCGCFSTVSTDAGSDPVGLLIRDILLLIPTIILIFYYRKKREA